MTVRVTCPTNANTIVARRNNDTNRHTARRVRAGAEGVDADVASLKFEIMELPTRVKRVLRRLDIANTVYRRLERLDARWGEGIEGENAWHRLDGLSVNLEELRKRIDNAVQDYHDTNPGFVGGRESGGFGRLYDMSDHSSNFSCGSSADFDIEPIRIPSSDKQRQRHMASGDVGRQRSRSAAGARAGRDRRAPNRRRSSGDGGESRSGGSTRSGTERAGHRKKRRRQGPSKACTRDRGSGVRSRRARGDGCDISGQDWMLSVEEATEDEGTCLPGLDYNMAAEPNEAEDQISREMFRDSSLSSLSSSSRSRSTFSSRSRSPSLGRRSNASFDGHYRETSSGGNRAGKSGGGTRRQHSPSRSTERGRSAGEGGCRRSRTGKPGGGGGKRGGNGGGSTVGRRSVGRLGDRRSSSTKAHGSRRHTNDERSAAFDRSSGNRDGVAPTQGRKRGRRHRSLMEVALFHQRLAEQEARGGRLQPSWSNDGEMSDPASDTAAAERGVGVEGGGRGKVEARGSGTDVSLPSKPPMLPSLVKDLLPKPQLRGLLRFKTLYSVRCWTDIRLARIFEACSCSVCVACRGEACVGFVGLSWTFVMVCASLSTVTPCVPGLTSPGVCFFL